MTKLVLFLYNAQEEIWNWQKGYFLIIMGHVIDKIGNQPSDLCYKTFDKRLDLNIYLYLSIIKLFNIRNFSCIDFFGLKTQA